MPERADYEGETHRPADPLGKGVPTEWTGDPCPCCPDGELVKPRSELRQCPTCRHVEGGQNQGYVLPDYGVTYRQARRLLGAFGYNTHGTPGNLGTRLRQFARDHDLEPSDLGDLLADLTGRNGYPGGDATVAPHHDPGPDHGPIRRALTRLTDRGRWPW